MEKYRLQIAFDIKDEQNKSVLPAGTPNTLSREVRTKPSDRQVEAMWSHALTCFLSLLEESPEFLSLFCLETPYGYTIRKGSKEFAGIEIPSKHQRYMEKRHSAKSWRGRKSDDYFRFCGRVRAKS